jgi:hypothetical protein
MLTPTTRWGRPLEGYAAIYGFPEGTTEIARSQWCALVVPDDLERLESRRRSRVRPLMRNNRPVGSNSPFPVSSSHTWWASE